MIPANQPTGWAIMGVMSRERQLLEAARKVDANDPLGGFRGRFQLPTEAIYLDGNSLGAPTKGAIERVERTLRQEWATSLVAGWTAHEWIDLPQRAGAKIAAIVGAGPDEVLVTDTTTINLFRLAWAARRLTEDRRRVLIEADNFPADNYMLQGLVESFPLPTELVALPADELAAAVDHRTAMVVASHVSYRSGAILDLDELVEATRPHGALTLIDLAHSVGVVPVDLGRRGIDLAVGCGYKYLNGGPGAPAFLYVRRELHERVLGPLWGWLGHAEPFAFEPDYRPAAGIRRHLCGTPPILSLSALDEALASFAEVELEQVRAKSMALTAAFVEAVESGTGALELVSPRDAALRGSQVAWRHPEAWPIVRALQERRITGDFRAPDLARFGFAPLYNTQEEAVRAGLALADVVERRAYDEPRFRARRAVT